MAPNASRHRLDAPTWWTTAQANVGARIMKFKQICSYRATQRLLSVQLLIITCVSTFPQYVYCNNSVAPTFYLKMIFFNYKESIGVMY